MPKKGRKRQKKKSMPAPVSAPAPVAKVICSIKYKDFNQHTLIDSTEASLLVEVKNVYPNLVVWHSGESEVKIRDFKIQISRDQLTIDGFKSIFDTKHSLGTDFIPAFYAPIMRQIRETLSLPSEGVLLERNEGILDWDVIEKWRDQEYEILCPIIDLLLDNCDISEGDMDDLIWDLRVIGLDRPCQSREDYNSKIEKLHEGFDYCEPEVIDMLIACFDCVIGDKIVEKIAEDKVDGMIGNVVEDKVDVITPLQTDNSNLH